MKIGWIGLGMIGAEMVKRLLGAGFPVTAYARGAGLDDVRALGAATSDDYVALAAASDLLVVCVFSDAQLRDVLFAQGALARMRSGSILAIHTTGSPALAREIAERALGGVSVLDATFSGGPHDIQAGALTIMVGGDKAALEQATPAFSTYAKTIHHVGGIGSGQIVKLLNNLLFATNLMNAAEILKLAEDQAFDASAMAGIIGGCSGASYAMQRFQGPAPMGAMLERVRPYLEKDVATAMAAGLEAGLDLEAFAATADYFRAPAAN